MPARQNKSERSDIPEATQNGTHGRDRKEVQQLIDLGKAKGFLTYEEVNDALPADVVAADQVEDVMSALGDEDIEIVDAATQVKIAPKRIAEEEALESKKVQVRGEERLAPRDQRGVARQWPNARDLVLVMVAEPIRQPVAERGAALEYLARIILHLSERDTAHKQGERGCHAHDLRSANADRAWCCRPTVRLMHRFSPLIPNSLLQSQLELSPPFPAPPFSINLEGVDRPPLSGGRSRGLGR